MTAQLPATHSAIQLQNPGDNPDVYLAPNLPLPELSPGKVLIKNTYGGINYLENYLINGLYPVPSYPRTLGHEGEGHIAALGPDIEQHPDSSVRELKIGDRVAYIGEETYAQYTATPVTTVLKLPEGLGEGIGAAAILQGLTAITFAREAYPAQQGDIVLVHAAAGGVGLLLVQYLSKVIGARVIATASSDEKLKLARESGAEWTLHYGSDGTGWVDAVKEIPEVNSLGGIAAVFDSIGKNTFDGGLEILARKGTFVCFGNASGSVPPLQILRLGAKNIKLVRPQLNPYIATRKEFTKYADELCNLLQSGTLKVKIHKTYPWGQVTQALEDVRQRGTTGKLLIKIDA